MAPDVIIAPLLDPKSDLRYHPTRFIYIGAADSGTRFCATLKRWNIAMREEAQQRKTIIGGMAPGSSTVDQPFLHNRTSVANFEVVSGYPGSVEIALVMDLWA